MIPSHPPAFLSSHSHRRHFGCVSIFGIYIYICGYFYEIKENFEGGGEGWRAGAEGGEGMGDGVTLVTYLDRLPR